MRQEARQSAFDAAPAPSGDVVTTAFKKTHAAGRPPRLTAHQKRDALKALADALARLRPSAARETLNCSASVRMFS